MLVVMLNVMSTVNTLITTQCMPTFTIFFNWLTSLEAWSHLKSYSELMYNMPNASLWPVMVMMMMMLPALPYTGPLWNSDPLGALKTSLMR